MVYDHNDGSRCIECFSDVFHFKTVSESTLLYSLFLTLAEWLRKPTKIQLNVTHFQWVVWCKMFVIQFFNKFFYWMLFFFISVKECGFLRSNIQLFLLRNPFSFCWFFWIRFINLSKYVPYHLFTGIMSSIHLISNVFGFSYQFYRRLSYTICTHPAVSNIVHSRQCKINVPPINLQGKPRKFEYLCLA